jgi:hypothetical protein
VLMCVLVSVVLLAIVVDTVFLRRMGVLTKLILQLLPASFLRRLGVLESGTLFPLLCYCYCSSRRSPIIRSLGGFEYVARLEYVAGEDSGAGRRD